MSESTKTVLPDVRPPHSKCLTCGIDLATPEAAQEHRSTTLEDAVAAAGGPVSGTSGHSTQVVNPTPEEAEERRLQRIVEDAVESAMERAFDDLDRAIDRGRITEAQVSERLRSYPDFVDGWDEWRAEADR